MDKNVHMWGEGLFLARIGVLSDTHGLLRREVLEVLQGCDQIIHAGDFADAGVLEALEDLAPVYAVRGNNDWGSWASHLPRHLVFEVEGVRFCMAHDRSWLPWDLQGVQVVIFGHSHQYFQEQIEGRLWLNPGSCGYPRFRRELSMAVLTIEEGRPQVQRIDIRP